MNIAANALAKLALWEYIAYERTPKPFNLHKSC